MHKKFLLSALCGIVAMSAASAQAISLTIDSFSNAQKQTAYTTNPVTPGSNPNVGTIGASGAIGANRTIFVEKTSGLNTDPSDPTLIIQAVSDAVNSQFTVSRASGIGGNAMIQWDGGPTAPTSFNPMSGLNFLLGVNLLAYGEGISIRVLDTDLAGQTLTLSLFTSATQGSTLASIPLPALNSPQEIKFAFADFLLPANIAAGAASVVNLTSVGSIVLQTSGPVGADISMDIIGVYAPEPTSIFFSLLGCIPVLSEVRRRRRQTS